MMLVLINDLLQARGQMVSALSNTPQSYQKQAEAIEAIHTKQNSQTIILYDATGSHTAGSNFL